MTDAPPSLTQLINLRGRRAAVTGAARGIGSAIAARLAEAGAAVVLLDRDGTALRETASVLTTHGVPVHWIQADLADDASLLPSFKDAVAKLGGLDIWINNAGISPRVEALAISKATWDNVLDVNLGAAFVLARLAGEHMIGQNHPGVIVNMVSTTIKRATGNPLHYRVSKHG